MTATTGVAAAVRARPLSALHEPHHDGSELYVVDAPDRLGGEAVVRLRAPRGSSPERVLLRYVRDGEPHAVPAEVDEETDGATWWRAVLPVGNPVTRYRWLLAENERWAWVNGLGRHGHDVPDADDFVLGVERGPDWHLRSVVYEVFPDRFARSGRAVDPPDWVVPRAWDELPTGRGPDTPYEWYGGDLTGLEARLDHVVDLGASVLYLTPLFEARSTHRYDAVSFDRIDPLLGGDEALASLTRAAHARGLRVVSDITPNHVGRGHEWFRAAQADSSAPEHDFFYFDDTLPHGYEAWYGIPSLPKLNWRSPELRRRMADVVERWLAEPYALDGWRVDVANMSGRRGEDDLNAEVARVVVGAARSVRPDALVVVEHGFDYRPDLQPGRWPAAMNYAGFLRPVWMWLRAADPADEQRSTFWGMPAGMPTADGPDAVAAMRAFRAGVPWDAVAHSWTLVDSHDVGRLRTISGSRERQLVGVGMQFTTPGVPMVFAGDELGLEGAWGEDARRSMPWEQRAEWDAGLLDEYRRLASLRRSSEALADGGIRYAAVTDDAIAYLREAPGERLLCLATRAGGAPVRLGTAELEAAELETLHGGDAETDAEGFTLPADGPAFHVWRMH
jgi:alpha-glucosidase